MNLETQIQMLKNQHTIMLCLFKTVSEGTYLEDEMRKNILSTESMILSLEHAEKYSDMVQSTEEEKIHHGKWIVIGDNQPRSKDKIYTCSECKVGDRFIWGLSKYCPNCGAKMDNPEGE